MINNPFIKNVYMMTCRYTTNALISVQFLVFNSVKFITAISISLNEPSTSVGSVVEKHLQYILFKNANSNKIHPLYTFTRQRFPKILIKTVGKKLCFILPLCGHVSIHAC